MSACVTEFDPLPAVAWAPIRAALDDSRLNWKGVSLAALGTVAARFDVECIPFERHDGTLQWQASRWVGSFQYAGQSWSIAPRIGWPRFIAMLGEIFSVGIGPVGGVASTGEADLASLAWLLAFNAAWRHNRGTSKAFIRREVSTADTLRGQLDLGRQLGKRADRHTFACSYDELTYDNPINRGTLLALKVLKQHARFPFNVHGEHHRIAREWQEALLANGVQTPTHFPAEPVRWSRANDQFRAAHLLARLVVGERRVTAGSGRDLGAFLFDSAEVWEMYLYGQLRQALAGLKIFKGFRVDWPRGRRGDPDALMEWEGRHLEFYVPDLRILRSDDTVALVIDAKYRRFKTPSEDPEIAWQMFRYAAAAARREVEAWPPTLLLYPRCEGLNDERPTRLGRGYFLVQGKPPLIAESLELPPTKKESTSALHAMVQAQLQEILVRVMSH